MLEAIALQKHFRQGFFSQRTVRAVDGVSLCLTAGETLGLTGNSGSGKSTLARMLAGLIKPSAGRILYQDVELPTSSPPFFTPRRRPLQMIFQNPLLAFDPRQQLRQALLEPLLTHRLISSTAQGLDRLSGLLHAVGLEEELLLRYPHQISGGQAQRLTIARALSLEPELLIADEPAAMLDVVAQAQVMALLHQLQNRTGIGMLLISHDTELLRASASRVLVMVNGQITAAGTPAAVFGPPATDLFSLRRQLTTT
ncbi:MAG TPA: dipeptide/oligopeptide/nickel ABC transporter ATP-binding protein [Patescibacteria group bacterium]|nr:dipeptide/oligopeptide/nickel ABC transporter ATP-binding protein [Patescibacteria group bacterium]